MKTRRYIIFSDMGYPLAPYKDSLGEIAIFNSLKVARTIARKLDNGIVISINKGRV